MIVQKLEESSKNARNRMTPKKAQKVYERLMSYKNKKGEKITQIKMNKLKDKRKVYTHKPKTNRRNNSLTKNLVKRMDEILEQRQQKLRDKKMEKVRVKENEIKMNCTFTPEINKSPNDR